MVRYVIFDDGGDGMKFTTSKLVTVEKAHKLVSLYKDRYGTRPQIQHSYADILRKLGSNLDDYEDTDEDFRDVLWVIEPREFTQRSMGVLNRIDASMTGYFGNEANEATIYSQAIIFVDIPDFESRTKLIQSIKPATFRNAFRKCLAGKDHNAESEIVENKREEQVKKLMAKKANRPKRSRDPHYFVANDDDDDYDYDDEEDFFLCGADRCTCGMGLFFWESYVVWDTAV